MDLNPVDIENSETYANWQGASVAYAVLALSIDGVAVSRPAHPQVISVWLPTVAFLEGVGLRSVSGRLENAKMHFVCVYLCGWGTSQRLWEALLLLPGHNALGRKRFINGGYAMKQVTLKQATKFGEAVIIIVIARVFALELQTLEYHNPAPLQSPMNYSDLTLLSSLTSSKRTGEIWKFWVLAMSTELSKKNMPWRTWKKKVARILSHQSCDSQAMW